MDTGLRFISLVDIALRGHTAFRQGTMLELHRRTSVVGKDAEKRETDQQLFQITFPPYFAES